MSSNALLSRLVLGATIASSANAHAAIVVFDTNGAFVNGAADMGYGELLSFGSINPDGTFTTDKRLYGGQIFTPGLPWLRLRAETYYDTFAMQGSGVSFDIGLQPLVSSGSYFINYLQHDLSAIPDFTFYLGLRLTLPGSGDVHYGWIESSRSGNTVNVPRFAFNDVAGQSIFYGQTTAVPEASTLGLVGGLFGLVAAAHVRRRRAKQAAASDKFLALAAGEKLN
jgi:hypothetical protein